MLDFIKEIFDKIGEQNIEVTVTWKTEQQARHDAEERNAIAVSKAIAQYENETDPDKKHKMGILLSNGVYNLDDNIKLLN